MHARRYVSPWKRMLAIRARSVLVLCSGLARPGCEGVREGLVGLMVSALAPH